MNRTEFIGTNLYYSQEFVDDMRKDYEQEIERLNKILGVKKIPEKIEEYIHTDSLNYNQCNYMFEKLTNKYNEIIDYLKSKGE